MSSSHETGWDGIYHRRPLDRLPWELGRPRRVLVELVESELIEPSTIIDLCGGAGTNPVYLAEKGFDVTALDVSDRAMEYATARADNAGVRVNFLIGDFLNLPFKNEKFKFAFDFGCFHHVETMKRTTFIKGVFRVLNTNGIYLMVCFSDNNGPAWNHFKRDQIVKLFGDYFVIERIEHVSSIEADKVTRFFYEVLMRKTDRSTSNDAAADWRSSRSMRWATKDRSSVEIREKSMSFFHRSMLKSIDDRDKV